MYIIYIPIYTHVCVMERPGPVRRPSGSIGGVADGGDVEAQSVRRISLRAVRTCLTTPPLSPLSDSTLPPSSHTSRRLNPHRANSPAEHNVTRTIFTSSFVFFTDMYESLVHVHIHTLY